MTSMKTSDIELPANIKDGIEAIAKGIIDVSVKSYKNLTVIKESANE